MVRKHTYRKLKKENKVRPQAGVFPKRELPALQGTLLGQLRVMYNWVPPPTSEKKKPPEISSGPAQKDRSFKCIKVKRSDYKGL